MRQQFAELREWLAAANHSRVIYTAARPVYGIYTAQGQYMGYPPQQAPQKSKKGLLIGLIIGGAVLVSAAVVLVVLLTGGQGKTGIIGKWFESTGASMVDFHSNGTFDFEAMGIPFSGTYTFDEADSSGEITVDAYGTETTSNFYLEDDILDIDGTQYTRDYVDQKNLEDMLKDFDLSD